MQRSSLKICLLLALVSASMAFMAIGAQGAQFLVNKETALAKAGVTFQATQIGQKTFAVPGRVDILCGLSTITGEFVSSNEAKGSAQFSKCSAWQPVKVEEGKTHTVKLPCTVSEPIIVANSKAQPIEHSGEFYIKLLEIKTIVMLTGPECPLTKENVILGVILVKVHNSNTVEPVGLASQAIQKLLGAEMHFGTLEAFIKGEWSLKLTDAAHVGQTVGVI